MIKSNYWSKQFIFDLNDCGFACLLYFLCICFCAFSYEAHLLEKCVLCQYMFKHLLRSWTVENDHDK